MFGFIKKMFIGLLKVCTAVIFDRLLVSNYEGRIKFVSLNSGLCQTRPALGNINSTKTLYYPFTVSVNKCGGSCNTTIFSSMCSK